MKTIKILSLAFIVILSLAFSCHKPQQIPEGSTVATLYDYTGLDGCSRIIKLENEEVLEPINLTEFTIELKEGKKVWIKYTEQNDLASICMVGPIVRVDTIWER